MPSRSLPALGSLHGDVLLAARWPHVHAALGGGGRPATQEVSQAEDALLDGVEPAEELLGEDLLLATEVGDVRGLGVGVHADATAHKLQEAQVSGVVLVKHVEESVSFRLSEACLTQEVVHQIRIHQLVEFILLERGAAVEVGVHKDLRGQPHEGLMPVLAHDPLGALDKHPSHEVEHHKGDKGNVHGEDGRVEQERGLRAVEDLDEVSPVIAARHGLEEREDGLPKAAPVPHHVGHVRGGVLRHHVGGQLREVDREAEDQDHDQEAGPDEGAHGGHNQVDHRLQLRDEPHHADQPDHAAQSEEPDHAHTGDGLLHLAATKGCLQKLFYDGEEHDHCVEPIPLPAVPTVAPEPPALVSHTGRELQGKDNGEDEVQRPEPRRDLRIVHRVCHHVVGLHADYDSVQEQNDTHHVVKVIALDQAARVVPHGSPQAGFFLIDVRLGH
mmetsp:Transcript_50035/g.133924  ORF Transcript_50035/g.133924 Transcript_50035/m.133924 type:complete len:443 (+) Transcript_50035:125-1453(+)